MGRDSQSEVIQLLKDVQKQLGFLEKKIDNLSGATSKESFKPRSYSPSFRPSGGSRYKEKQKSSFGPKKAESSLWYEKKRGDGKQGAVKNKKRSHKSVNKKRLVKSK